MGRWLVAVRRRKLSRGWGSPAFIPATDNRTMVPGEAVFVSERCYFINQQKSCAATEPFNHLRYGAADGKLRTSSSRSAGEGVNAIGPVIRPVNHQPGSRFPSVTGPDQCVDVMEAVGRPVDSFARPT